MNERERRALRPTAGARLLLELIADGGARATYAAWVITPDGEQGATAELDDGGEVTLAADFDGAEEMRMLATLTARGAAKRRAEGLPAWPPRVLRWKGPGRGA